MSYTIKISNIEPVTHDVKRFQCEKPQGYHFTAGQATDVSIHKPGWEEETRPFTFTALSDAPYLEFTIKIYSDHPGVTHQLDTLVAGDELIIDDPWGAIEYKGPGYFIAGGAGITPFIAVLRQLKREGRLEGNTLLFSNKTDRDVILEEELTNMLGDQAIYTITDAPSAKHRNGFINEQFLKDTIKDFSKHFYLCGPPAMVEALQDCLARLGVAPEALVFER